MHHNPKDLLKGSVEVSSLPMVYYKINEAINRPNTSMADIGKIISDDTGLTVRLLRLLRWHRVVSREFRTRRTASW